MIFGINCDTFFQQKSSFLKLSVKITLREKCQYLELFWSVFSRIRTRVTPNTDTFYAVQAIRKLGGINFRCIWSLSCSSDLNLLLQKFEFPQSRSSKNPDQIIPQVPSLLSIFKTKYHIKCSRGYTNNYCYLFLFLHNFKLKIEVIID